MQTMFTFSKKLAPLILCIGFSLSCYSLENSGGNSDSVATANSFTTANNDLFYEAPSSNFVIRWAFQELCDFVFDPRYIWPTKKVKPHFNPAEVKPGNIIFVRDAVYYFKHVHPKIEVPYIIITSGEYLDTFQESFFKHADHKNIIAWFTVHPCKKFHPKVFPIALGIIQYPELYEKREEVHKTFLKYRKSKKERLLYMNFTDWKNPERKKVRDIFIEKPFCDHGGACPFTQYIKDVAHHKFVISPPGLGPDCYRIYESLLVGTIPVVKHSYLDWLYEGLPVLFIDDWNEVTQEFLEQKYAEITSRKYDPKKLYMEYWIEPIKAVQAQFYAQQTTKE